MAEVASALSDSLTSFYHALVNVLPSSIQVAVNLLLISLMIVAYAVLVWNFYRWIARKDLIQLNLNKYNTSEHSVITKLVGGIFYFLEYIIILPLIVFIWFAIFTIFLVLLTENLEIHTLLVISVTVVTAIRMTAYYKEDLSRDVAKLIPLTLLGVAITQGILSFEKILSQISNIPSFFPQIWLYLGFIIGIEIILRALDLIFYGLGLYEEEEVKAQDTIEEEKKKN